MARLSEQLKERYNGQAAKQLNVEGLPDIFYKPLTLQQAREISEIDDPMQRIAKTFQVRAKDCDGNPLVRVDELPEFVRYSDVNLIADAVGKMNLGDEDFETTEKKY